MESINVGNLSDEALVKTAQNGDNSALSEVFTRYEGLVRSKASAYYVAGADEDDVVQEGRIGLLNAIRSFDVRKNASFLPFAVMCIKNQIITAMKKASRLKHAPLNSYVSLDNTSFDDEENVSLGKTVKSDGMDPETILIDRENREGIEYIISKSLSSSELEVLNGYLNGETYKQIAEKTGRSVKSVDNSLQSIKRKLKPIKP